MTSMDMGESRRRNEDRENDRYPRDNFPREQYAGGNSVAPPASGFPPPPHLGGENGSRPGSSGGSKYSLMSYRQFIIALPEYITPAESAKKYDEYLSQHAKKARMDFFHSHHHEDWLKAKYHPSSFEVCFLNNCTPPFKIHQVHIPCLTIFTVS